MNKCTKQVLFFGGRQLDTLPMSLPNILRHNASGKLNNIWVVFCLHHCCLLCAYLFTEIARLSTVKTNSIERTVSIQLNCIYFMWCWIQLEHIPIELLVLNILLISKIIEDLLSMGVLKLLPWNSCALLDACDVDYFFQERHCWRIPLFSQSVQVFTIFFPSCCKHWGYWMKWHNSWWAS